MPNNIRGIRDVHPLLAGIRDFLLGRLYKTHLRIPTEQSPRPGPPPVLPESSYLTIAGNHYYKRDVRREVGPPNTIPLGQPTKQITAGGKDHQVDQALKLSGGAPLPGRRFQWKQVDE